MFVYERYVHVYETDLMGIVHHSNYLRFCEEARVEWCRKNLNLGTDSQAVFGLTVLETRVKHLQVTRYADQIKIYMQARFEGVRLYFQYKLLVKDQVVCVAETSHCSLDLDFKVKRLDREIIKAVGNKVWIEIWL